MLIFQGVQETTTKNVSKEPPKTACFSRHFPNLRRRGVPGWCLSTGCVLIFFRRWKNFGETWHSWTSWWFEWKKQYYLQSEFWWDMLVPWRVPLITIISSWWFRFNPFEKYDRQNGSFPQVGRDENKKIFELKQPSLRLEVLMNVKELKVCFPV